MSIGMKKNDAPIVVEQAFDASLTEVWNAITQAELMRQWFFDNVPEFKAKVGFETSFVISSGERQFTHVWKVTDVLVNKLLRYGWKCPEYDGDGYVQFELSEKDDKTVLKLTNVVTEDYPDGIMEFERASGVEGWNYFIKERLKEFLCP